MFLGFGGPLSLGTMVGGFLGMGPGWGVSLGWGSGLGLPGLLFQVWGYPGDGTSFGAS